MPIATLLPARKAATSTTIARATLSNSSPLPTRAWVPFALPYGLTGPARESTFLTDRGLHLRASKGWDEGTHTTMWLAFAPLLGGQSIEGALLVPDGEAQDQPFVVHPWCSDDLKALVPHVRAKIDGKLTEPGSPHLIDLIDCVDGMGAMQRFHFVELVPDCGLVIEGWTTFYHGSPIADVDLFVGWSDRSDPAPIRKFEGIAFGSGKYAAFDDLKRVGVPFEPFMVGDQWLQMLT